MKNSAALHRFAWAALIMLALALRLGTPAGYMPYVEGGKLVIGICDDGDLAIATPMRGMGDEHSTRHHEPCPYTSVSSFGAAPGEFALLVIELGAFALLVAKAARISVEIRRGYERPPAIGPPLTA